MVEMGSAQVATTQIDRKSNSATLHISLEAPCPSPGTPGHASSHRGFHRGARPALGPSHLLLSPDQALHSHASSESRTTPSYKPHSQRVPQNYHPQTSDTTTHKSPPIAKFPDGQLQLELLGYKQEFQRTWDFWSSFALSFCNVAVFVESLSDFKGATTTAGPLMMTGGFLVSSCFTLCLFATNAELASGFPVAGAMFTWTYKLARASPRLNRWARLLSWVVGFFLFSSHIMLHIQMGLDFSRYFAGIFTASGVKWTVTRNTTQGLAMAYVAVCGLIATTSFARSPRLWKVLGAFSALLHICVCLTMVSTARQPRAFLSVFEYRKSNRLGFKSKGWAFLRGWASSTVSMGSETATHMAEETKDPASTVPRVIFWSCLFSLVMQMLSNVCLLLVIGPMNDAPIRDGLALEGIFRQCPKPVAQFVGTSILFSALLSDISQFLTASRFFWALARDKALPFAKFWRQVTPDRRPLRAMFLFIVLSLVLAVVAYEPSDYVVRLARESSAFLVVLCYIIPTSLYIFSSKDVLDRDGRNIWRLRGFSKPIACIALCFLLALLTIYLGPSRSPITTDALPWAALVVVGFLGISLLSWYIYGNSHYVGPVKSLTVWTAGHEVEIPKRVPQIITPEESKESKNGLMNQLKKLDSAHVRSPAYLLPTEEPSLGIPHGYGTYNTDGSLYISTGNQDHSRNQI